MSQSNLSQEAASKIGVYLSLREVKIRIELTELNKQKKHIEHSIRELEVELRALNTAQEQI